MINPSSSDLPNPSENQELPITESNNPPSSSAVNEDPSPSEIATTLRAMADAAATITNLGTKLEQTSASSLKTQVSSANISSNPTLRGDDGKSGDFFNQLKGVPIDYLISTPLVAAARSNMALAEVMLEFIDLIGFDKDGKTRLITFILTRPDQNPVTTQWEKQTLTVEAPLLGLVPIPALLIDSVDIKLNVNIKNTLEKTLNTKSDAKLTVDPGWGWAKAEFTGSIGVEDTHRRQTDQSATFEVEVRAEQQELPEGMARLMDVMASCITPLPSSK